MNSNRLTKSIFLWSKNIAKNNWVHLSEQMFRDLSIEDVACRPAVSVRSVMQAVDEAAFLADYTMWHHNLWDDKNNPNGNKLRTYRCYKVNLEVEKYLLLNLHRLQRRTLAMLRIGVLPLEIETGRYAKPKTPLSERLCGLCNIDTIEDERHFLLHCPLYDDQRDALFRCAINVNRHFVSLSNEGKFVFLMTEPRIQSYLAKSVNLMYNRRNIFRRK